MTTNAHEIEIQFAKLQGIIDHLAWRASRPCFLDHRGDVTASPSLVAELETEAGRIADNLRGLSRAALGLDPFPAD